MKTDRGPDGVDEPSTTTTADGGGAGDPAADRTREDAGRGDVSLPRRSFVLASGAYLGTSMVGPVGGRKHATARRITVTATAPYRPSVVAVARSLERSEDGVDVHVRAPASDPFEGLRVGESDVHVSGRPPSRHTDVHATDRFRGVSTFGWAALTHPKRVWRECLTPREERACWTDRGPVETWSETDWESVATVDAADGTVQERDDVDRGCRGGDRSGVDRTTVVLGTRSHQYARGFGGVGYYEVDRSEVDREPDAPTVASGSNTPLVRLGYVYATGDSAVDAFTERLGTVDPNRARAHGNVRYFAATALESGEWRTVT